MKRDFLRILVLAIGLLVGTVANVIVGQRNLQGDESEYLALADNLNRSGIFGANGYRAYRAPGYPFVLAQVRRTLGPGWIAGRILQIVPGALMLTGAFLLGRRLAGTAAGLVASGLLLVDSYWWLNQVVLLQENLFSVFLVVGFLLVVAGVDVKKPFVKGLAFTASGIVFGSACLVKATLIPLLGLVWLAPVFSVSGNRRRAAVMAVLFVLGAVVTILPWTFRNYRIFGRLVPISTNGGITFAASHSPATYETEKGTGIMWYVYNEPPYDSRLKGLTPEQAEIEKDRIAWEAGWSQIKKHGFKETTVLVGYKLARFWSPSTFFGASNVRLKLLKFFLIAGNVVVLTAFFLGLVLGAPYRGLVILVIAGAMATTVVFWGSIRFRYPLSPIICAYAAATIVSMIPVRKIFRRP